MRPRLRGSKNPKHFGDIISESSIVGNIIIIIMVLAAVKPLPDAFFSTEALKVRPSSFVLRDSSGHEETEANGESISGP